MAEKQNGLSTEFISHPGDTLLELLEQYNISQKELALKTQTSETQINLIINGKKSISVQFAKKLENVLKPKASFWINRQNIYDEKMESIRIRENITDEEKNVYKCFPIKNLISLGYLEDKRNEVENILALRKFASLSNLLQTKDVLACVLPKIAFRMDNTCKSIDPYKLYSWLRICQIQTDFINNPNDFNLNKLKLSLEEIKKCSNTDNIQESIDKVTDILFQCGINYRVVESLPSLPVKGYIKTVNNKISLCTTIRGKYEDGFWFTLFHELGHLISKRNDSAFVDLSDEDNANDFARNHLISQSSYDDLIKSGINERSIKRCAIKNDVCPAIIVGRLQNDKRIKYSEYNYLRRKIATK